MIAVLFKWLMIAGLLAGNGNTGKHPIYMSVAEIGHNAKDRTLEISCKIFTDDFEKTLRMDYKGIVDLINPKNKAAMNKLVNEYIQKHFSIKVDGKAVALEFLGYEQQEEGITSFFQGNNVAVVKNMEIIDNILYEYKKEQISLLHVTVNGNRKSTRLVNPEDSAGFEF